MPLRVVSLLEASTDMVCRLGQAKLLVGRSHECTSPKLPEMVLSLPMVTKPEFSTGQNSEEGLSEEIDAAVRTRAAVCGIASKDDKVGSRAIRALSCYSVDGAALKSLAPDLIIVQDQCEVCAVTSEDLQAACSAWLDKRVQVLSLKAQTADEVFQNLREVAAALEVATSSVVIPELVGRWEQLKLSTLLPLRVAAMQWLEPPMGAGQWIPDILETAGLDASGSFCEEDSRATRRISWDEVASFKAELVVPMVCGFGVQKTLDEVRRLAADKEDMRAALNGATVAVVDGNRLYNVSSAFIMVESAEQLAAVAAHVHARAAAGASVDEGHSFGSDVVLLPPGSFPPR